MNAALLTGTDVLRALCGSAVAATDVRAKRVHVSLGPAKQARRSSAVST
jgi:hypothetical protein